MRRIFTVVAAFAGSIVFLALLGALGIWFQSERVLAASVPVETFDASGGSVDHGSHLAKSVLGCENCHGVDLAGGPMIADPPMATLWASNLTRGAGGIGTAYSDTDFEHAIRHGVRPSGGAFIVMPSSSYASLSDQDTRDLIAYLRSIPPVDRTTAQRALGPIGRAMLAFGKIEPESTPIDTGIPPLATTPAGVNAEFGHYLAAVGGCMHCHSVNLGGGASGQPNAPPAPDLTSSGAAANWTPDQFLSTLREGQNPSGHFLDKSMPWQSIGTMTDDELHALDLYVKSLPPANT